MNAVNEFWSLKQFENQLYKDIYEAIFLLWNLEAKGISITNEKRVEESTEVYQQIISFFTPDGDKDLIRSKVNKYIDFKTIYYNRIVVDNISRLGWGSTEEKDKIVEAVNNTTNDMNCIIDKLSHYFTYFYPDDYVLVIDFTFLGNREEMTDLNKYEIHVYVEYQNDENLPF